MPPQVDVVGALQLFDEYIPVVEKKSRFLAWKFRQEPDDVKQILLATLWQCALKYDASLKIPFGAYLYTTLKFEMFTAFRYKTKLKEVSLDAELTAGYTRQDWIDDLSEQVDLTDYHAENNFWSRVCEAQSAIETCETLTGNERKVMRLQFIDGFSQREVATKLKMSKPKLSFVTFTAVRKLTQYLGLPHITLRAMPYEVDKSALMTDILQVLGADAGIAVNEVSDKLNALPDRPWRLMNRGKGMRRGWIHRTFQKMGIRTFTDPESRSLHVSRHDLLRASRSVGSSNRAR
jgi:RNA polymerase sigma factor (sigma-70 family)